MVELVNLICKVRIAFFLFVALIAVSCDKVSSEADEVVDQDPITGYVNLSESSTANCYIVNQGGSYRISAVRGNDASNVLLTAKTAEVMWESFGSSLSIGAGALIKSVMYKDGYICFKTNDYFKKGNAVVAAKDESGNILWSWHIWITDQPQEHVYNNDAGTLMDRNLGATSAEPNIYSVGLMYQWGRTDPFMGPSSFDENAEFAKSSITWPAHVASDPSTGTVEYAIANPTTFITYNENNKGWYYTSSSQMTDISWGWANSGKAKSIYDPCPAGWRVPDGGQDGVWVKAGFAEMLPEYVGEKGVYANMSSSLKVWFPNSGYLSASGRLIYSGYGCCWSASSYWHQSHVFVSSNMSFHPIYSPFNRATAAPVRCIKE